MITDQGNLVDMTTSCDQQEGKWFAVYTIVRHEKAAGAKIRDKGVEVFLPLRNVISQWKDRRKKIQLPLFPGYLFAKLAVGSREMWNVVNTPGVVRVLGAERNPSPVPNEQIHAIKALMESGLTYDPETYCEVGREVMVMSGPLHGIKGKILERRGAYRLILCVDLIQRSVAVEVDVRDVELI